MKWNCVNALNGLLLISTENFRKYFPIPVGVNALNGLLLISTAFAFLEDYDHKACQCPQRASTHFYENIVIEQLKEKGCVNALNGLLLISTMKKTNKTTKTNVCQCPQRASTHFYHIPTPVPCEQLLVSMPSTGFYSFLRRIWWIWIMKWNLCQCPQRASTHFYGSLSEALILLASESWFYK